MVSPDCMSLRAILCPRGTRSRAFTVMVSSVSMIHPVRLSPAGAFSTTITPTESALSCTMKCVVICVSLSWAGSDFVLESLRFDAGDRSTGGFFYKQPVDFCAAIIVDSFFLWELDQKDLRARRGVLSWSGSRYGEHCVVKLG